jgi:ketosteroid isomerase-like protein
MSRRSSARRAGVGEAMSQDNVERIRDSFRLFQSGDQGWVDRIDPDIKWDFSAHPLPDVPNRGQGRERLLSEVLATYFGGWRDLRREMREVIDAGDDVVVVMHETARLRGSATALDRDLVEVWTLRDGLAVLFRVFPTKAAALNALGTGKQAMAPKNVELVRRAFGMVTIPGDPDAMIAASHPDFEMHLVGVAGEPVRYAGASGIREFFSDVAESWESFRFSATALRDLGDRVLVLGQVRGRGRLSGIEVDDRWAWIVELRDGRAASLRGFLDEREAIEAAGLGEERSSASSR